MKERKRVYDNVEMCELLAHQINAAIECVLFEIDFWKPESKADMYLKGIGFAYSEMPYYKYLLETGLSLYQAGYRCVWHNKKESADE